MLSRVQKIITKLDDILGIIGGVFLLGITFFICADVFMRAVFNSPFPGSVEICALAVVYVIYFGLAYGLTKGAHVRVTVILGRLPGKVQRACVVLAYSVGTMFFGVATWRSWIYFWKSFAEREFMFASINIPWYLGKFAVPIGAFLMCITCLLYLVLVLFAKLEERET
jgi:TRAP-type C4-dicarboxylate transport system permease small subunit